MAAEAAGHYELIRTETVGQWEYRLKNAVSDANFQTELRPAADREYAKREEISTAEGDGAPAGDVDPWRQYTKEEGEELKSTARHRARRLAKYPRRQRLWAKTRVSHWPGDVLQ